MPSASAGSSTNWCCCSNRDTDSTPRTWTRTIAMVKDDVRPSDVLTSELLRSARGRSVHPKTAGQKVYTDAIASHVVTFGIGPAGTGKSYLAVALAVQALQAHRGRTGSSSRARRWKPASAWDSCQATSWPRSTRTYGPSTTRSTTCSAPTGAQRLLERGTIEVAPLAFMRGRTLNRSFIILDEAQNTSPEQMKMFLTRIGFGSKAVVTGDVTQVDVPGGRSGLFGLETILGRSTAWRSSTSAERDVVRHRIVADIVAAYERADVEKAAGEAVKRGTSDAPDPVPAEPPSPGEVSRSGVPDGD